MKRNNLIITILCLSIGIFSACSGNKEIKETESKELSEMEVHDSGDFKQGTWRIDSVAENRVVIDRLVNDTTIQVFNFRKGGVFSVMEVKENMSMDRPIGTWKVDKDQVFIINEKGDRVMSYTFSMNESVLILEGGFEISSQNQKKPTFYLSKYSEKRNESVDAPAKK